MWLHHVEGSPLRYKALECVYLLLPSQECQDVACRLLGMYLQHCLKDSIQVAFHSFRQIQYLNRMLPSLQSQQPQSGAGCPPNDM